MTHFFSHPLRTCFSPTMISRTGTDCRLETQKTWTTDRGNFPKVRVLPRSCSIDPWGNPSVGEWNWIVMQSYLPCQFLFKALVQVMYLEFYKHINVNYIHMSHIYIYSSIYIYIYALTTQGWDEHLRHIPNCFSSPGVLFRSAPTCLTWEESWSRAGRKQPGMRCVHQLFAFPIGSTYYYTWTVKLAHMQGDM